MSRRASLPLEGTGLHRRCDQAPWRAAILDQSWPYGLILPTADALPVGKLGKRATPPSVLLSFIHPNGGLEVVRCVALATNSDTCSRGRHAVSQRTPVHPSSFRPKRATCTPSLPSSPYRRRSWSGIL